MIEQAGRDFIAENRLHRRKPDKDFAALFVPGSGIVHESEIATCDDAIAFIARRLRGISQSNREGHAYARQQAVRDPSVSDRLCFLCLILISS